MFVPEPIQLFSNLRNPLTPPIATPPVTVPLPPLSAGHGPNLLLRIVMLRTL
jgi:hypothetical protein